MAIQFHCCLILLNYVLLAYVSFFSGLLSLVDLILIWLATKTVLDRPLVMVIVQILFPDYFRSLAVFKSILVCLDVLYIIQLYFFLFLFFTGFELCKFSIPAKALATPDTSHIEFLHADSSRLDCT